MLCILLTSSRPAQAWGERGHRIVNAAAIENLPEPLRSYFRARQDYLVEHAIDPDVLAKESLEERPHHYTEVEAYDSYPFASFRRQFVDERREPSSAQLRHGDSVWQVEHFTLRLTDAFRRRRWDEADHDALFAAHYACDLTQPLHTLLNYDGQLTSQAGIHARFETSLVNALADHWVLKPQPSLNEPDLRTRILREYLESYNQRYLIFAADRIAAAGRSYGDPQFLPTFVHLDGPMAKKRLEAAVSFVSSLWYTAWVRAGKPQFQSSKIETRNAKLDKSRRQ